MNVWECLSQFLGKIRPQIFLSLLILHISSLDTPSEVLGTDLYSPL